MSAENIEVFGQNSIRVTGQIGRIYIDPFGIPDIFHDAAYVFVTHDHYDHFSPEDIEKVCNENTILIVPEKMEKKARKVAGLVKAIVSVTPGFSGEVDGFRFETVPAYNILKPFHPKSAEWVGYILIVDGQRIYIAGDTDATKEAEKVKCDVALVPIGGTYTMDPKKAAELVNTISPAVTIPVHYGSIVGKPSDGETFAQCVDENIKVEFKICFE